MTPHQRPRSGALANSIPPATRKTPAAKQVCHGPDTRQSSDQRTTAYLEADKNSSAPGSVPVAAAPNDTIGCAWPEAFLTDFESRIWMTYRSNFTPIPRNNTPEAASSMTLGVRLRSQLMDSQGFTSDTGWGCMMRSGQSLLANTLCILLLGRGDRGEPFRELT